MKINSIIYLGFVVGFSGFAVNSNKVIETGKYVKVDSCIYVKFKGEPEKCFYQTPLGDVTIFEYRPANNLVDSNLLYAVALYKEPSNEINDSNQLKSAISLQFNSLINSEETMINNLSGKILSKNDVIVDNRQVIKYKVFFTNLSEMDQIEGQKDVIYNAKYLKCKGLVIKLWTYTQLNKENKMIEDFFNSLKFTK